MKYLIWISIMLFLIPVTGYTQDYEVSGTVQEEMKNGEKRPLVGVVVYWLNATDGVNTDLGGKFTLMKSSGNDALVFSLFGFKNDTIYNGFEKSLNVELVSNEILEQVDVVHKRKSTETSFLNPMKVERINEGELQKAACCSLSESFETSPTIDVSFTDAITGTRQIQMLGLAGPNIQITRESMPAVRGFNAIYGMEFIPGTWIESIQLNKGTGSVVNGFESIAGQMNVELRKPEDTDKMYLNLYGNEGGRLEGNMHFANRLNSKWSTGILLHAKSNQNKVDRNEDGFLDNPIGDHFFALNRWKYVGEGGMRIQFGVKFGVMDQQGGQLGFDPNTDEGTTNSWGMLNNIQRIEGWSKIGKVFSDSWKSLGLQLSAIRHDQDSYFGLREYDADQNSVYANLIYQSILSNTNHKFRAGANIYYDEYLETLGEASYDRTEVIPGTFFEYTYNHRDKFNVVAGIRGDYHNLFGAFVTPRLHLRYQLKERDVLRLFAGRGQRTANILSENSGFLSSSRQVVIFSDHSDKPYGLDPEIAWNGGLSYTKGFIINHREVVFSLDFYRTEFENQIVADLDANVQQIQFYNLNGKSYSNSVSTQIDYELFKQFDVRLAYRWNDVKTNYSGQLLDKAFISKNRAFINTAYETKRNWKFDATLNWQDKKRIPTTATNPEEFRVATISPDFFNLNAQISKKWKNNFEAYIGVENLLNYTQENPIIDSANPFSDHFDSSLVWGPIFGRNTYLGLRYRIK